MGSRTNTYLELSVYIAQYEDYCHVLIDHLTEKKVGHWDLHVRELTAKALNRLTRVAPCYLAEKVMPVLLKNAPAKRIGPAKLGRLPPRHKFPHLQNATAYLPAF